MGQWWLRGWRSAWLSFLLSITTGSIRLWWNTGPTAASPARWWRGTASANVFADTGPTAVLSPVYAYLLAGIFRLFGSNTPASVVTALAINSLFSALTCIPVFLLARRCFGDRVAKWAGWLWAFSPYGVYYGAEWAWSTCLLTLLLCWLFLMALELENSRRILSWIGFGLLCGVSALTEPVALSVLPFLGAWTCYRRYRQGRTWLMPGVAASLAFLAVLSPWIIRNYETFHQFIPVRSGLGTRTVYRQQRLFRALGEQRPAS